MPTGDDGNKKGGLVNLIVPGILIALVTGGTAPWWYHEISKPQPAPASATSASQRDDAVSQDFIVGRWQVQKESGQESGESVVDYLSNGTFAGHQTVFENEIGRKIQTSGKWEFQKLSAQSFDLRLLYDDRQTQWQGRFKVIDQDHIHNINENYVAVRLK